MPLSLYPNALNRNFLSYRSCALRKKNKNTALRECKNLYFEASKLRQNYSTLLNQFPKNYPKDFLLQKNPQAIISNACFDLRVKCMPTLEFIYFFIAKPNSEFNNNFDNSHPINIKLNSIKDELEKIRSIITQYCDEMNKRNNQGRSPESLATRRPVTPYRKLMSDHYNDMLSTKRPSTTSLLAYRATLKQQPTTTPTISIDLRRYGTCT